MLFALRRVRYAFHIYFPLANSLACSLLRAPMHTGLCRAAHSAFCQVLSARSHTYISPASVCGENTWAVLNRGLCDADDPVCTADGYVFDILHIVPYIKKLQRHPVTAEPLQIKDLIKLQFHKCACACTSTSPPVYERKKQMAGGQPVWVSGRALLPHSLQ